MGGRGKGNCAIDTSSDGGQGVEEEKGTAGREKARQERDRKRKTERCMKTQRKRESQRQEETDRNLPREDVPTDKVSSSNLVPSQRDGGADRPREGGLSGWPVVTWEGQHLGACFPAPAPRCSPPCPSPRCPCPVPSSVRSWDLRGHLIHMELIHFHLNHLHELP